MAKTESRFFDEYLVIAVQAGDRAAGERLAARWRPRLLRTARRLLGDDAAAEDAVQEAWVSLARGLARLEDPARFPAFAFRILHRRCADSIAATVRRRDATGAGDSDIDERADAAGGGPVLRLALRDAFAALPPDQRVAATLYYGEALTVCEIAAATQAPVGTVKSRLFHARRKLKAMLEGEL